jgi:hypothetical protein
MDAVRVAAGAVLLLTALAAPGCGRAKREPAVPPAPPAAVARVGTLRVGLPKRGNLLFNSDGPVAPHLGLASYTAGYFAGSWLRVTQPASDSAGDPAPDTLFVSSFQDATDEEIALERGDLDVAVFWPGEVSARMRADERFRDPELGLRERGVLAFLKSAADSLNPPRADMEVLNREAFGGDLLPWSEPDSVDGPPAHYAFDPYLPGARHLERILARIPSAGATRTVTLKYLDIPVSAFKTPVADASPTLRDLVSIYRPLFVVRCAVLARPGARAAVRRIGADAFAQLAPRDAGHDQWDSVRGLYR